jgi:hypothetical protein
LPAKAEDEIDMVVAAIAMLCALCVYCVCGRSSMWRWIERRKLFKGN